MADIDKAIATQLANIENRTGRTLDELAAIVRGSGIEKHAELVAMLKRDLGMGHGDANTLVHHVRKADDGGGAAAGASAGDVLDALYAGPKAPLRPIHDRIIDAIRGFGDFEEAPKKTYVSLRRKKQFAMVGPATKTQVEVGLNAKALDGGARLQALPAGQMCNYKVRIAAAAEVDDELIGWIRAAYDAAG